jgi:hypothetical protein
MQIQGYTGRVELRDGGVTIFRNTITTFGMAPEMFLRFGQIEAVEFGAATRITNGFFRIVPRGWERGIGSFARANDPWTVFFRRRSFESFEELRRAVEQAVAEAEPEVEPVPNPAEEERARHEREKAERQARQAEEKAAGEAAAAARVAGGEEVLNPRTAQVLSQSKAEGENVRFCLITAPALNQMQALVALDDRLLIIKPGFMSGSFGGYRATSFYYADITGIEVNQSFVGAVIEVNNASYASTPEKDYWNTKDPNSNPWKVSNCLPVNKTLLNHYKPYLDELRGLIREAKRPQVAISQDTGLAGQLEQLATLRTSGVLSEEEFQRAKEKLLG